MVSSRTHAPGAEGAPLLANELESLYANLGRAERDRATSTRLIATVAVALLVTCVGAVALSAVAANGSGNAITRAASFGSIRAFGVVDPDEASGARPASASGAIDEDAPLLAVAEDRDALDSALDRDAKDESVGSSKMTAQERLSEADANGIATFDDAAEGDAAEGDAGSDASEDALRASRNTLRADPMRALFDASVDGASNVAAADLAESTSDGSGKDAPAKRRATPARSDARQADGKSSARSVPDDADAEIDLEMRRLYETSREMDDVQLEARNGGTRAAKADARTDRRTEIPTGTETNAVSSLVLEDALPLRSAAPTTTRVAGSSSSYADASSELKARYARAVEDAIAGAPARATSASESGRGFVSRDGTCDFAACDVNAGPQIFDPSCVRDGGLGCLGKTGCRFCKAGAFGQAGFPTCPPCVCATMSIGGCAEPRSDSDFGGFAAVPGDEISAKGARGEALESLNVLGLRAAGAGGIATEEPAANAADGVPSPPPDLPTRPAASASDVPGGDASAAAAAVAAEEEESGTRWLLTRFGFLESCADRCARAKRTCVETQWPSTFSEFLGVVVATVPDEGRDGICAQVSREDDSRHCASSAFALSGRCIFQPSRTPSCAAAADDHSDCQRFCPCA